MKLATFRQGGEVRLGIVWEDKVIDFNAGSRLVSKKGKGGAGKLFPLLDMRGFLARGASAIRMARKIEAWVKKQAKEESRFSLRGLVFDLSKVKLLAPLNNPPRIMCLARNYASHIREVSEVEPIPEDILIFMKPTAAIIGPEDPVLIPPECQMLDHEVELAVVVGKKGRHIPRKRLWNIWPDTPS